MLFLFFLELDLPNQMIYVMPLVVVPLHCYDNNNNNSNNNNDNVLDSNTFHYETLPCHGKKF